MMVRAAAMGLVATALALAGAAYAKKPASAPAAQAQPVAAWPCEKDPKPALALADYWPGADRDAGKDWRGDPTVAALVADIEPRSVSEQDAATRIRDLAGHSANRSATMMRVVAGLVETTDRERQTIINGIRRFNTRQGQIAKRIEDGYKTLDAPPPPASDKAATDQRAALDEQLGWDTRIFEDRQRMLPLICKQPDFLETRLKSLTEAARSAAGAPTGQP